MNISRWIVQSGLTFKVQLCKIDDYYG